MQDDCLFCKVIRGEIPSYKVYEDEHTFAFLDIFPVSKGHFLIVPKEHAVDLDDGSVEAAQQIVTTLHGLAPRVMKALGATAYNVGMNVGKDAGQEVFHTHLHVMPRYAGEPRTFEKTKPSQEELAAVAEEIQKGL